MIINMSGMTPNITFRADNAGESIYFTCVTYSLFSYMQLTLYTFDNSSHCYHYYKYITAIDQIPRAKPKITLQLLIAANCLQLRTYTLLFLNPNHN